MGDQARTGPYGAPDPVEVLSAGDDRPRLHERWRALPPRTRGSLLGSLALVLTLAAGGYAVATRPEAPPPPPPPYPAQDIRITFTALRPGPPDSRDFTVELRAAVKGSTPVSVLRVTQGYEGLRVGLDRSRPVEVTPRGPRKLIVRARVVTCRGLPLDAGLPFLDITLRNARARQVQSVIPGDRYARALSHRLRTLCEPRSLG